MFETGFELEILEIEAVELNLVFTLGLVRASGHRIYVIIVIVTIFIITFS